MARTRRALWGGSAGIPLADSVPGPLLRLIRDQRVAFVIVGGINTVNGFTLFVVFHLLFGDGFVHYMSALFAASAIAMAIAFNLHRRFVFRVRGHVLRDFGRFLMVNLGMLGLNAVLLPFLVEVVRLPVILAQVAATVVIIVVSYVGHRSFSFRRPALRVDVPTPTDSGA